MNLKEEQYIEYKHKKQKYLLELDYETILSLEKEKLIQRYRPFYISKVDSLYKGILKNYSIQLADSHSIKLGLDNEIYEKIFKCLDEYVGSLLSIKIEQNKEEETCKQVLRDYDNYQTFEVGKLDEKDYIEKKAILLAISRVLFTHSIPLSVAEQCYAKLIKDTRKLIVESVKIKQEECYKLLIKLLEEYNVKLISTKVYWDNPKEREEYKKFMEEYKGIVNQTNNEGKEVLFIKYDLKKIRTSKESCEDIIKFYKEKLVKYGAIRQIKNTYRTIGSRLKKVS